MKKTAKLLVKFRIGILCFFTVLVIIMAIFIPRVSINYDNVKYLPKDSNITQGIDEMIDNFGDTSDLRLMYQGDLKDVLELKDEVKALEEVKSITFVDDLFIDMITPVIERSNITKNQGIIYFIDIINVLPENAAELSVTELQEIVTSIHQGDENYDIFLTNLMIEFITSGGLAQIGQLKQQFTQYMVEDKYLFYVVFTGGVYSTNTYNALDKINAMSDNIFMSGQSIDVYNSQNAITRVTTVSLIILVIVVLLLLFVFTKSFFEPVIYIIIIAFAVIINLGSNIIFPSISSITNSIASIMQLVLTIDYSIFLMNNYRKELDKGLASKDAMESAFTKSLSPISASSFTTLISFIALMFMQYKIGLDIGLVLGKGVLISLLTVFLLMPGLVVLFNKILYKSRHKEINIKTKAYGKFVFKGRLIIAIVLAVVIAPSIYFQTQNNFIYGTDYGADNGSEIDETFGVENNIVILMKSEYALYENEIGNQLLTLSGVKSVTSLSSIEAGGESDAMIDSISGQFVGENNYRRIIVTTLWDSEGEEVKQSVLQLDNIVSNIIVNSSDDDYYLLGVAPANIEIEEISQHDFILNEIIINVAIFIILVLTFKSLILPLIILVVIQGAIGIANTLPLILNMRVFYLAYLIVTAVLLGATIDYAILMTNSYLKNNDGKTSKERLQNALSFATKPLLLSASIFVLGGVVLSITSQAKDISMFGTMIAIGGFTAFTLVELLLPALLVLSDKIIIKKKKI